MDTYKYKGNRILAYGTLRRYEPNFQRIVNQFGIGNYNYKFKTKVPGFLMYDLIHYPAVIKSPNLKDIIIAEVYDCSDTVYEAIQLMELNAGYHEELVCLDDRFYSIFVMASVDPHYLEIDSGDWVEHINHNQSSQFHY